MLLHPQLLYITHPIETSRNRMKLDALDKRILSLMSKDGRISSSEIARNTGENERKVFYRVNALLQSDAISMTGP